MSDEATDLLIYGVAAAKANSRDEARYYLEWVLRTDPEPDQEADAWYWLSTITDDRTEKRSCLESALAASPSYPEARRDLAILDGRLRPGDLLGPLSEGQAIHPHPALSPGEVADYKCPRCGARLTADVASGKLVCSFCGYRPAEGSDSAGGPATPPAQLKEQDWDVAIFSAKGHNWEVPTARTFVCQSCAARVFVPAGQVSTSCPFCGTPYVVEATDEQELIEPTGILPFKVSAGEATASVVRWLSGERFVPEDLSSRATQAVARPIYLPAWTFDVSGEIRWSGYEVRLEYKHLITVPASGDVPLLYEDLMVPATKTVPADLLDELHFDLHNLVAYSPDALANWPAEIYSISPVEASLDARGKAIDSKETQSLVHSAANPGGTLENVRISGTSLSIISYKLVLLPVWLSSYNYAGRTFRVAVNGHSGYVAGDVPRKLWQKVLDRMFE